MTKTVPAELASAIEGCWNLAPRYRIVLRQTKTAMTVEQQTVNKLGKPVSRTDTVEYDPADKTLHFAGIGDIHRVVVILRSTDAGVESAFRSEISPGKWLDGTWEKAERCPAAPG